MISYIYSRWPTILAFSEQFAKNGKEENITSESETTVRLLLFYCLPGWLKQRDVQPRLTSKHLAFWGRSRRALLKGGRKWLVDTTHRPVQCSGSSEIRQGPHTQDRLYIDSIFINSIKACIQTGLIISLFLLEIKCQFSCWTLKQSNKFSIVTDQDTIVSNKTCLIIYTGIPSLALQSCVVLLQSLDTKGIFENMLCA